MRAGLALFGLELRRMAAWRWTCAVRAASGLALLAVFGLTYAQAVVGAGSAAGALGTGEGIFLWLLFLLHGLVFLLLPGWMGDAVAGERERGTLSLLQITGLAGWTIVFVKYASRLLPMLVLLGLSLPLFAMAHALGGLEVRAMLGNAWLLAVWALQVGAIALFASCCVNAPAVGFVWPHLVVVMVLVVPYLESLLRGTFFSASGWGDTLTGRLYAIHWAGSAGSLREGVVRSLPALVTVGVFLGLSRAFLYPGWRMAMKVKARRARGLPGYEPLAWRDSIGPGPWASTPAALALSACFLALLLAAMPFALAGLSADQRGGYLGVVHAGGWLMALVLLAGEGTSVFAANRLRRSLDVLLVAPLSGYQIVLQRARASYRAMLVVAGPFLGLHLVRACVQNFRPPGGAIVYLVGSLACLAVYLPLAVWFATWIGLRLRTPALAVPAAILGLLAWTVVPVLLVRPFVPLLAGGDVTGAELLFCLLTPAGLPLLLESVPHPGMLVIVPLNAAWYWMWVMIFRNQALWDADGCLGRA